MDPIKEQENENEKQNGEDKSVVASEEASKDVSKEKTKSSNRQQYETLVTLLRKCVKLAKQSRVADREASKEIDKKCFFALNPKKLIDKRIKRLTLGNQDVAKESTVEPL